MNDTTAVISWSTEEYDYPDSFICHFENVGLFKDFFKPLLYCLSFTFGLIGNILVIFVLICWKKLSTMTDVYLLNMAISDLTFVFSIPFLLFTAKHQWVFGNVMCKIISALYFTGFFSGIFFIMVMSVDRYLAVVHVVCSLRFRTVKWGSILSVIIWILAFFFSMPNFIVHQISQESDFTSCSPYYPEGHIINWRLFSYLSINMFGLIIPLGILIFCYSHIIKNLRNSKNKQKRYAIKLILLVVVVFFLFWAPFNIVVFLQILQMFGEISGCQARKRVELASDVTQTLAFVHCCLNPIIYTFAGEKFQKYLYMIFNKALGCVNRPRKKKTFQISVSDRTSSTTKDVRASSMTEEFL
ncbi:C-C chemokine receptor type 5-like [Pelodytes ibericus]